MLQIPFPPLSIFFHIWCVSNLYISPPPNPTPPIIRPLQPAAKFQPWQEQREALTSEGRCQRRRSDKEVGRSQSAPTDDSAITKRLCLGLRTQVTHPSQSVTFHPSMPGIRLGWKGKDLCHTSSLWVFTAEICCSCSRFLPVDREFLLCYCC